MECKSSLLSVSDQSLIRTIHSLNMEAAMISSIKFQQFAGENGDPRDGPGTDPIILR